MQAHTVLEFLAIFLRDKSLTKKYRKAIEVLNDRLEFITTRLEEVRWIAVDSVFLLIASVFISMLFIMHCF